MKHIFFAVITAITLLSSTPALAQNDCGVVPAKVLTEMRNPHSNLTMVAAHRGIHSVLGDGTYDTPENSLQSLSNAGSQCIEVIEVDVRLTQDGVPILTHDENWGRETNVGSLWGDHTLFNAWADPNNADNNWRNPAVSSWSVKSVQQDGGGLLLRNSVDWKWFPEYPPTLEQAINYIKNRGIGSVIAIDIKDNTSLLAAWAVVARLGFYNQAVFKLNAKDFPSPNNVQNFFDNYAYVNPWGRDSSFVKVIMVYNTENIAPLNGFGPDGGEQKVYNSVKLFEDQFPQWLYGIELNMKSTGGILSYAKTATNGIRSRVGIFNPWREWEDSAGNKLYFRSTGFCCAKLDEYWFNKTGQYPYLPHDTEDRRTDWSFILDENDFGMITTDNVLAIRQELRNRGRRSDQALLYLRY